MPVPRALFRRVTAAVAALALVAAAGCGDDGHADHNSTVPEGARAVEVVASSYEFEPDVLEVVAGEPVEVRLEVHNERHDFVIDEVDAHVEGSDGDTAVGGFTAPEDPGEYTFYCSVGNHQELGMEGTLVVAPAS